jgi:hypothetical protein
MSHKRLQNRLLKLLKNVKLARKTSKTQNQDLSLSQISWMTHGEKGDLDEVFKIICQNSELQKVIHDAEKAMEMLINIFGRYLNKFAHI